MGKENRYTALAIEDLVLDDTVVIEHRACRKVRWEDLGKKKLYSVIDREVSAGQMANLVGGDTMHDVSDIFHIEGEER